MVLVIPGFRGWRIATNWRSAWITERFPGELRLHSESLSHERKEERETKGTGNGYRARKKEDSSRQSIHSWALSLESGLNHQSLHSSPDIRAQWSPTIPHLNVLLSKSKAQMGSQDETLEVLNWNKTTSVLICFRAQEPVQREVSQLLHGTLSYS